MQVAMSSLAQAREAVAAGQLSRHELYEEIERRLSSDPGVPIEGALEIVLEEIHNNPRETHPLRLLARIYERNGDDDAAARALAMAANANQPRSAGEPLDEAEPRDLSPGDRLLLARVLCDAGFYHAAADLAVTVINSEPNSLTALNLLARIRHVQGRITETIALWQRVAATAPRREGVLAHLALLHQLSQDEELAGHRFMAVGQGVYVRKDDVQVDVEKAFALFRRHDIAGALSACENLIAKSMQSSPLALKIGTLQKAWIQERTGDSEGARSTLEALGRMCGFEVDVDRLSFLGRLYERLGDESSLRRAVHIYEHLKVHAGKLSVLPRLAAVHRALGNDDDAQRYADEFERAFARRMHKPTAAEVLRALAIKYIPLERVDHRYVDATDGRACSLEVELARTETSRQRKRALLAYVCGDTEEAAHRFAEICNEAHAMGRDFAYLGDLRTLLGKSDTLSTYVEALRRGGFIDPALWRNVLARPDELKAAAAQGAIDIETLLADGRDEQAHKALTRSAELSPGNAAAWRDLAVYEELTKRSALAASHGAKAMALRDSLATQHDAHIGRALCAAVYQLGGKPKGVVHEIIVSRFQNQAANRALEAGDILGNVEPTLQRYIHQVIAMTTDYCTARWPHRTGDVSGYSYSVRITKDDQPTSGQSLGLPVAVAVVSVLVGKSVPQDIAMSGTLVGDSRTHLHCHPVGDAPFKVKGAHHRDLRGILLPAANRAEVEQGDVVPLAVGARLVRYVEDLDEAVEALWGRDAWHW